MEENMGDVSHALRSIKGQAKGMNAAITKQNSQVDRLSRKV
jgi:hypothetical protein